MQPPECTPRITTKPVPLSAQTDEKRSDTYEAPVSSASSIWQTVQITRQTKSKMAQEV